MFDKVKVILDFWFGTDPDNLLANQAAWWKKDPAFDGKIRDQFQDLHRLAAKDELDAWKELPQCCLALVILLDQFSRNMYRDTPQAFAFDAKALSISQYAHDNKLDKELPLVQRQFLYMPFEHAEDLDKQKLCMALMRQLMQEAREQDVKYLNAMEGAYQFAEQHYSIIKQFGRFPHRNRILNRTSTEAELAFLQTHSGF